MSELPKSTFRDNTLGVFNLLAIAGSVVGLGYALGHSADPNACAPWLIALAVASLRRG